MNPLEPDLGAQNRITGKPLCSFKGEGAHENDHSQEKNNHPRRDPGKIDTPRTTRNETRKGEQETEIQDNRTLPRVQFGTAVARGKRRSRIERETVGGEEREREIFFFPFFFSLRNLTRGPSFGCASQSALPLSLTH